MGQVGALEGLGTCPFSEEAEVKVEDCRTPVLKENINTSRCVVWETNSERAVDTYKVDDNIP